MSDTTLSTRVLDWYERELRHWSAGAHGHSESFRMGVMHALTEFNKEVILSTDIENAGLTDKQH